MSALTAAAGAQCKSWTSLGFQSETPATDFRSGGVLACEQLLTLAQREPEFVRGVCGPDLDYPFAAGCINITHMLCGFLGLLEAPTHMYGGIIEPRKDCTLVAFVRLLLADRLAFDTIYAHCVHAMHRAWREMHAEEPATTLLDFPRVRGPARAPSLLPPRGHSALAGRTRGVGAHPHVPPGTAGLTHGTAGACPHDGPSHPLPARVPPERLRGRRLLLLRVPLLRMFLLLRVLSRPPRLWRRGRLLPVLAGGELHLAPVE